MGYSMSEETSHALIPCLKELLGKYEPHGFLETDEIRSEVILELFEEFKIMCMICRPIACELHEKITSETVSKFTPEQLVEINKLLVIIYDHGKQFANLLMYTLECRCDNNYYPELDTTNLVAAAEEVAKGFVVQETVYLITAANILASTSTKELLTSRLLELKFDATKYKNAMSNFMKEILALAS